MTFVCGRVGMFLWNGWKRLSCCEMTWKWSCGQLWILARVVVVTRRWHYTQEESTPFTQTPRECAQQLDEEEKCRTDDNRWWGTNRTGHCDVLSPGMSWSATQTEGTSAAMSEGQRSRLLASLSLYICIILEDDWWDRFSLSCVVGP